MRNTFTCIHPVIMTYKECSEGYSTDCRTYDTRISSRLSTQRTIRDQKSKLIDSDLLYMCYKCVISFSPSGFRNCLRHRPLHFLHPSLIVPHLPSSITQSPDKTSKSPSRLYKLLHRSCVYTLYSSSSFISPPPHVIVENPRVNVHISRRSEHLHYCIIYLTT